MFYDYFKKHVPMMLNFLQTKIKKPKNIQFLNKKFLAKK